MTRHLRHCPRCGGKLETTTARGSGVPKRTCSECPWPAQAAQTTIGP